MLGGSELGVSSTGVKVCVGSRDGVSAGPGACRLEPVPDPGVRSGPGLPSRLGLSGSSRSRGFRPFWGWAISVAEAERPQTCAVFSITTVGSRASRPSEGETSGSVLTVSEPKPAAPTACSSSLGPSTFTSGGRGWPKPDSRLNSSDFWFGASGGVRITCRGRPASSASKQASKGFGLVLLLPEGGAGTPAGVVLGSTEAGRG